MKKATCLILALVLSLSLVACGTNSASTEPSASPEAAQTAAVKKDTLTLAIPKDIADINVHLYAGSMVAQGMVFEGLVQNTAEGVKPCLAESWDVSSDGKV